MILDRYDNTPSAPSNAKRMEDLSYMVFLEAEAEIAQLRAQVRQLIIVSGILMSALCVTVGALIATVL